MNAQLAWEMRERGLLLPETQYDNPRLAFIAKRMRELSEEWDCLDKELKEWATNPLVGLN